MSCEYTPTVTTTASEEGEGTTPVTAEPSPQPSTRTTPSPSDAANKMYPSPALYTGVSLNKQPTVPTTSLHTTTHPYLNPYGNLLNPTMVMQQQNLVTSQAFAGFSNGVPTVPPLSNLPVGYSQNFLNQAKLFTQPPPVATVPIIPTPTAKKP